MTCDDVFDLLTRGPFPSGGPGDEQVEDHLAYCTECRRLATALQPAMELFQESIGPEESAGLPGYRGHAALAGPHGSGERGEDASSGDAIGAGWRPAWSKMHAASRPRPTSNRARRAGSGRARGKSPASSFVMRVTKSRTNLLRFAAAVLLGVAAAAGTRGLVAWQATSADFPGNPRQPGIARAAGAGENRASKPDLRALAGLVLPAACRRQAEEPTGGREISSAMPDGIQLVSADTPGRLDCCTDCHSSGTAGLLPAAAQSIVVGACSACH